MILEFLSFKAFVIYFIIASILYVHFRGKVRFKFVRQLTDHSSLMAPLNAWVYLFSKVPSTPYLERKDFPELDVFKNNWEVIREEAKALMGDGMIKASDKYDDIGFNSFFRTGWKRFYLKWYSDEPLPSALQLCPKTVELIKQVPSVNAAMFTLLPKGSRLVKHRDPYAGSIRYHLGLVTPNSDECRIFVDGEQYSWRDGEDVVFDETFIHYAENNTDIDRIIFFCDVQRPLHFRVIRFINKYFSKYFMGATATKNLDSDKVGAVNKAFKYLYQIRLQGKRLKKYNRKLYYFVKYALMIVIFGGILWLI